MRTCARIYFCKHQAEQDRGMRGTSRGIAVLPFVSPPIAVLLRVLSSPSFASDFSRRRGPRVVAPIVTDDSDGRPCGLLLYHRHGETCDGGQRRRRRRRSQRRQGRRVGGTGMRYQGNQIVCARRIHVGRTNDGPLTARSGMRRSRKRRGKAGGISRASPSDVLFSTRILKNANASFSLLYRRIFLERFDPLDSFPLREIFVEQHVYIELLLRFLRAPLVVTCRLIKLNVDEWKFVSLRNCMCDVRTKFIVFATTCSSSKGQLYTWLL